MSGENPKKQYGGEVMFGQQGPLPCFFCGERDKRKLHVHNIGISFGMTGRDYNFCNKCLKSMTAYQMWKKIVKTNSN